MLDEPGTRRDLMYYAGLTHAQLAPLLPLSVRPVERDWRFARARLATELTRDGDTP